MKSIAYFLIFGLMSIGTLAQTLPVNEFKKALADTKIAIEHAGNAEEYLSFCNGAENIEIRNYLLNARMEMDSVHVYTKRASYKASDAVYALKDHEQTLQQQATKIKVLLKTCAKSIQKVGERIDVIFINPPTNFTTYLYQAFEDFDTIQNKLEQAKLELKSALKTLKDQ